MAQLSAPPKLIVFNVRPGFIRGGRANPELGIYALDSFTPAQLAEIVEEPAMYVAIGHVLGPDDLGQLHEYQAAVGRAADDGDAEGGRAAAPSGPQDDPPAGRDTPPPLTEETEGARAEGKARAPKSAPKGKA